MIWKLYIIAFISPMARPPLPQTPPAHPIRIQPPLLSGTFRLMYRFMKWNEKNESLHCHHVLERSSHVGHCNAPSGRQGVLCKATERKHGCGNVHLSFFSPFPPYNKYLHSPCVSANIYGCSCGTITGGDTLL